MRYLLSLTLAVSVCGLMLVTATATAATPLVSAEPQTTRYQLTEEWSVSAQGPIHLREKRVKATYHIDLIDHGMDSAEIRRLQIRFVQVAVDAEIPAQKRTGSFDSRTPPAKLVVDHHELVRPIALLGQSLQLGFRPGGILTNVDGVDAVSRRLDEMYDEFLRGSEQDLYTREMERQRIQGEELCRAWQDVFLVRHSDLAESELPQERTSEVVVIACIPSESWMRRLTLPTVQSFQVTPQSDGLVKIIKTATLAELKSELTTIGNVPWRYDPKELKGETTLTARPDGRVEMQSSSVTAVLSTTLSLGMEVPIQMTIRHSTELSRP